MARDERVTETRFHNVLRALVTAVLTAVGAAVSSVAAGRVAVLRTNTIGAMASALARKDP